MGEKIIASIVVLIVSNLGLYARKIIFNRIPNADRTNKYINIALIIILMIYILFG